MVPQVRAAALTNFAEVARFVGIDPERMLRRARIRPQVLDDPEALLAARPVGALLEEAARESGCLSFGLLMAESRRLSNLGPLSLLLRHQATARDVVEAVIRYQSLLTETLDLSIEDEGDISIIRTDLRAGLSRRQSVELVTGLVCRTISEVVGGTWHPDSAHFVHGPPPDLIVHHRVFQSRLAFRSDFNGLVCSARALDAPNPAAESAMARHAQQYLEMLVSDRADGSITERVRRSLYLLLPAGRATLDQVGHNLGLHPRALQRQLERDGATFAALLNEVRRELALRYLSGSTHKMTAIAQMTGYATLSSFTRWFTAEFGVAPGAWRAEERQERGAT